MTPRALPAAYTRFTRLLALREWFATRRPARARLGLEAMEDRVVPTVSGSVWYDLNGNGAKDSGEGVVAGGATLELYDNGSYDSTTYTDPSGNYSFGPTGSGPFTVVLTYPGPYDGWAYSTAVSAAGEATPSGGVADFGLVGSGQMPGAEGVGTVSGVTWFDADADGVKDAAEWWTEATVVNLYWVGGSGKAEYAVGGTWITTDANGAYGWEDLWPGTYRVFFTDMTGNGLVSPAAESQEVEVTVADPAATADAGLGSYAVEVSVEIVPSVYGETTSLSAYVQAPSGAQPVPVGTVTFKDGATVRGTPGVTVDGTGWAYTSSNKLEIGASVAAYFAPAAGAPFKAASGSTTPDVSPAGTTTVLSYDATDNPIERQVVQLKAEVVPASMGLVGPGGTVTFWEGGTALGTAPVAYDAAKNKYLAKLTYGKFALGGHDVQAVYSGDPRYNGSDDTETVTVKEEQALAPDCGCGTGSVSLGGSAPARPVQSAAGVGYAGGFVAVTMSALSGGGAGKSVGSTPVWTSTGTGGGAVGNGVSLADLPVLVDLNDGTCLGLVAGGRVLVYFDLYDNVFHPRGGAGLDVVFDDMAHTITVTDAAGTVFVFGDMASSHPGRLVSMTDAAGTTTVVTAWDVDGNPTAVEKTVGSGGSAVTEKTSYSYAGGKMGAAEVERQVGAGSWETVGSAEYTYYDGVTGPGRAGDLKTAVVKDAGGTVTDTTYYRYYTSAGSGGGSGTNSLVKYAFGAAAYERLVAALGTSLDALTDGQVDDYADKYLAYDSSDRVVTAVDAAAGCSACAGGQGEFTYSYADNPAAASLDPNVWAHKTVETLPDGNTNTVYTNAAGQVMLKVYTDAATSEEWLWYTRYDDEGRAVLEAGPSAVSGYDEDYPDLVGYDNGNAEYLRDTEGLISVTTYATATTATTSVAGDAAGYVKGTAILRGETGTLLNGRLLPQSAATYILRTAGGANFYVQATSTVYENTNGTGALTTTTEYTWQGSSAQPASVTVTMPTVSTGHNGSGSATSSTTVYDALGRAAWQRDAGGSITYTEYDAKTGAVVKVIADVNTSYTGDFSGLPGGWSNTTGKRLTTTYEVDEKGRVVKATYPGGRVDYTVYDDEHHETRYYPAWNSSTHAPTGPTTVTRTDRANGYTETLTMSATPALDGSDLPTGGEGISGLLSLSRSYTNAAGQVTHADAYFDLSGLTYSTSTSLGTSGTNFYRTSCVYDQQGRQSKVVSPLGTITRTEYDGQGRAVSEWVGTDDTPTTGYWSVSNLTGTNLVKVRAYEYDGGGVGDGLLTRVTEFPGGGAADRVTETHYDWRGRAVATKTGVETTEATSVNRPITYTDYDNLGRVTKTRVYDGDGVTITTTSGVPDAPSSSLLRAQTTTSYDELGRAYRTDVYGVDPSAGTVGSNTLSSQTWYDAAGRVVKTAAPGGLVSKTQYDGLGRVVMTYTTDGGGDTTYDDADDVAGDVVLEQSQPQYDAAGNVALKTTWQRHHNATGTGALGGSGSPAARASYSGYYYDLAGRTIAAVDIGTSPGTVYAWPSTPPASADDVLVSGVTYDAAGRVYEATDPRGIVTRTMYDALGRTVKTVQNYVDGTVSDGDDKTTEYTYNAAGMTTLTAKLTGGGGQTTEWVYGVGSGSGITSNDVVGVTKWPDAATGAASSSEQETVTVNALGQVVTSTDRNGTVHTLTYDVLGRVVSDAVTTLGSGVDGAVRRVETAYDGQGNAYLVTSYDAASSGSVVNQVRRGYNGLGQVATEWQAHGGAVNTSTTPAVGYAYSEMAGGANHSRLTSVTYPGGYVLTYNYASGLNNDIGRLSSLSDTTGTLEAYSYLGLGTVVVRSHPQPDVDLTSVKRSGEADGDAGDQYAGLDRFGRVVDQRWVDASSGTATDRFGYGYDRAGNRVYRDNLIDATFGELYTYDGLGQIASFARGTLNGTQTGISGAATRTQDWDYDAAGNWDGVDVDGVTQSRTANAQNEVTGVGGLTTPTYDASGNMTGDEAGRKFVYDAWNRLVAVKNSSNVVLETFAYDGLNRRVTSDDGTTTTDLYYSAGWQVLEEQVGGDTTNRYVWSPVYEDAMVLRDRDTDADGVPDERLWVQQDANWNVTAVVDGTGAVVERYAYDPFGAVTVYDDGYVVRGGGSNNGWDVLWQGMKYDDGSGSYKSRGRTDISPTLGRPFQPDPLRFDAGDVNFYRWEGNNAVKFVDPSGLELPHGDTYPGSPGWYAAIFNSMPESGYQTISGNDAMRALGISKYDGLFSHAFTTEYMTFRMGCVGLNALRLGLAPGSAQSAMPGLRGFRTLNRAIFEQQKLSKTVGKDRMAVLFAVQSKSDYCEFAKYLKSDDRSEYDISKMKDGQIWNKLFSDYNYATAFQHPSGEVAFWEWMPNGGTVGGNTNLDVKHTVNLPSMATTVYMVVEIRKHSRAPVVIPGGTPPGENTGAGDFGGGSGAAGGDF